MNKALQKAQQPERQPSYGTGILPCQVIQEMLQTGEVMASAAILPGQIQPASIDLRLGEFAYPVNASFLPGQGKVMEKLLKLDAQVMQFRIPLEKGAVLEKGTVYLIPLLERVKLKSDVAGFANPKSSTGRLDILTRLITDGGAAFDQVRSGYEGALYLEVAPRSFSVVVKTGLSLNQLRFRRAKGIAARGISAEEWRGLVESGQVIGGEAEWQADEQPGMLRFTVDVEGAEAPRGLIGWRARKHAPRIDLERRDYEPLDFWEPVYSHRAPSIILNPDDFYILMTREAVAVPPDYAAEMLPYDTRAGEFRVHYAGFFDPGFGWNTETGKAGGSRGVLEVRAHEVPFLLEHGQTVGWLRYERMAAKPDALYGQGIGSNYQGQGLKLAKQFLPLA